MKGISVLGSTGSIGTNVLRVAAAEPDRFRIVSLAAARNVDLLAEQIVRFRPLLAVVREEAAADALQRRIGRNAGTAVRHGATGYREAACLPEAELVVSAVSGAAGLGPTVAAIEAGKDIALANKETMVMAGSLVREMARERGVRILPVDSEHSAIFQCLQGQRPEDVREIILTASGGPFLQMPMDRLDAVTPAEALRHPNWTMGRKITIDSASMMNKALEIIEARWLFDMDFDRIRVLVHPQSVVHSMVVFRDGAVLAQMGIPDMRVPIAYALSYPERIALPDAELDLTAVGHLAFHSPDSERFPALGIAHDAGRRGGIMPAVMNAANEEAVEAFLAGRIRFPEIVRIVRTVLDETADRHPENIDDILAADREARAHAAGILEKRP